MNAPVLNSSADQDQHETIRPRTISTTLVRHPHQGHPNHGRRTPGNPYASDATYEAAVVLANNRRCWDMIERYGARDEDGKVDPDKVKTLFAHSLAMYRITGLRLSEINWEEVAAEFNVEQRAEVQLDQASLAASPPAQDVGSGDAPEGGEPPEQLEHPAEPSELEIESETARRPIESDVLTVLRCSEITDLGLRLPAQQLDRKLYEKVDQVLKSVGGKWDRVQRQHRFAQEDLQALEAAIQIGLYVDPKDYGFFQTPPELVQRVMALANIEPHHLVLEPSAGRGALADAAARVVGTDRVKVVEMLDRNRQVLMDKGYELLGKDFLKMDPSQLPGGFDRIIMNPPFGREADIEHVVHAAQFLKDGGELVAIMSPGHTFRQTAKARTFRALLEGAGELVAENGAGAFKASGTDVNTVIVKLYADKLPQYMRPEAVLRDETPHTDGGDPQDSPRMRG
jgi:predicted RNA methylase